MAMNPVVWAFQPVKQLGGRLGIVEVEQGQAYADKLIQAGHVQRFHAEVNTLKNVDPTLPEVDFPVNPPAGGGSTTANPPKTTKRRAKKAD